MIINDFALLASDTARTKSYLQMMVKEEMLPEACIVYADNIDQMEKAAADYKKSDNGVQYFNLDEPILYTIKNAGIEYSVIRNRDINSDEIVNAIQSHSQKYFIYSGYGGYILGSHLFEIGKKYVHVHAGILPQYRGSTTAYYSMLQENYIGATAIFLSEGIDEGEILLQERFPIPGKDTNIDILYEPYVRSQVLKALIDKYNHNGKLEGIKQSQKDAQTYFIIHPVLKHIAMMGNYYE